MRGPRREVQITIMGIPQGTELVSEEFADLIENFNFVDYTEFNRVMQAEYRCWIKDVFDWCPADTRNLKTYLQACSN